MPAEKLRNWMIELSDVAWYVKRLSGNDTLANRAHQAGPYIPRDFLLGLLPQLNRKRDHNPRVKLDLHVDSHGECRRISAIWYNNKWHGGTRNETRLTGLGGASSALLDPENTGALAIFAFTTDGQGLVTGCRIWVCHNSFEEDLVEDRIGLVEPGRALIIDPLSLRREYSELQRRRSRRYWLSPNEIPPDWLESFPKPLIIMSEAVQMIPGPSLNPDQRLMTRRECEQELYESIEHAFYFPRISEGFESMKEFRDVANSVLQRRKARSGRSLELHLREIFMEEGLQEDVNFSYNKESDPGRRPDFLFPSADAYRNQDIPREQFRMLAVKTTCKDRWRQILNEAKYIPQKHLLTLQEGISPNQFREMRESHVSLVVPKKLIPKYKKEIRSQIQTLESFIGDVHRLGLTNS